MVARGEISSKFLSPSAALTESEHDHHSPPSGGSAKPLLTVADFDGNGTVNRADIRALRARLFSRNGDDKYHPLYDLNADYKLNQRDLRRANATLGKTVPLLDQQIALATQATLRYYGSKGLKNAIADGYIPFTQEAKGHGVHYINPLLLVGIGNQKQVDIQRPIGLNFNNEGKLVAVFYLRVPRNLQATPENPLQGLLVDPTDDSPPDASFDTLTAADWHHHHNAWASGLGSLNANRIYFEEDLPVAVVAQRLQQSQFKVFPASDQYFLPKLWMLHGWFHTLNPDGVFAGTNPNLSPYAPEELGDPHHQLNLPLTKGTEAAEEILGTAIDERINGFGGDDVITGNEGHDHLWGSYGNDLLRAGDLPPSSSTSASQDTAHEIDDILYGGAGQDQLYGQFGNDKLFGGLNNDQMDGGAGDDLLRGGPGNDIVKGGRGKDSFVLAMGEGADTIVDFKIKFDKLVLVGGIMPESLVIAQQQNDTIITAENKTLAILNGVNANRLIAAKGFVFA